jgi:hypothetical protein
LASVESPFVITDIVGLARDLFGLRETLRGVRREKRDRLADYLQQMAASLQDAERDLRAGGGAVGACATLHQYADLIPPTVDEALGSERTERLRQALKQALYVRGLPVRNEEELDELAEAAGTFRALGDYLRASS